MKQAQKDKIGSIIIAIIIGVIGVFVLINSFVLFAILIIVVGVLYFVRKYSKKPKRKR